jgi:hypothetical protein
LAAYIFPVTCDDRENVFVLSATSANPVMAVEAIGLTPMSPVILEAGTLVIPDLVNITNELACRRFTGARLAANAGCPAPTMSMNPTVAMRNRRALRLKGYGLEVFIRTFPFGNCFANHIGWRMFTRYRE